MAHHYTQNQIIQFIYKECDLFEKLEMEFAMEDDSSLLESYEDLMYSYKQLPKLSLSPSRKCVENILEYSRL